MIPESTNPHRDYPQMAADRGRIEPVPRRVRGYFNGILVFDTKAAHYVWEVAYYPQYYVPIEDVDTLCLVDEQHTQKLQLGSSRLFSLADGNRTVKSAARLYDTGPLAGFPLRLGRARLVRGGPTAHRPPAQPVCPGGCATLAPSRQNRTRRCPTGGNRVSCTTFRDGFTYSLLY
ncbi:hypothetical protein NIIDMKKI_54090 [Mycobacterium kansasii]|uniref:DUF427 domain-containing protein n=1 Tax=Mycobacterium kansasii TaxID=1768 RepID=A0A7G1IJK9_MYCKA|nr:hypothetical protein NIIDMKKI_54090 [Mycobacterium kansasii]